VHPVVADDDRLVEQVRDQTGGPRCGLEPAQKRDFANTGANRLAAGSASR